MITCSLVYIDQYCEPNAESIKRPGLALHLGSPKICYAYLGDENPRLSWQHTVDKWEEYCAIEQYNTRHVTTHFLAQIKTLVSSACISKHTT